MSNGAVKYGPTFSIEVTEAGLSGKPFEWTPYVLTRYPELTPADSAALDTVVAAHDPTKQVSVLSVVDFIGRFTNAEYRAATAATWRQSGGNAKNWDVVVFETPVNLNKKKVATLKTALVTDAILTQARADEIFAP
jgi:hypothetical protein